MRGAKIGIVVSATPSFQFREVKMSSNTVTATSFSTAKLSFSPLKVLDSGGKQAYVNYDNGSFVMQTPSCTLPYGMSTFDKAGPVKYSVELSLRGYDEAGKMKQFYEALSKLDEFMIDQGVKNSKQWFKAELNREVVKAFYTPLVRIPLDKEGNRKPYPPTIKLSLRQRRDSTAFETVMYDENRQEYKGISMEELLVKGAQVTALMQCTGVWFAGSKYGLSWKATQMRVDSLPQNARSFTFVDEGDDFKAPSKPSSKPSAPVHDEEEEEEEEDEAFSAPPPAPAKKQSVLEAMMPKAPAPAPPAEEEEEETVEPIPVPKKTVTTIKKKVVPAKK